METNKFFPTLTHEAGDQLLTKLLQELKSLNLRETIIWEVTTRLLDNPSKAMPYHGNLHTVLFIRSLCEIITYDPLSRVQLSAYDHESLILAALYHDYDYQGADDDSVNIEYALRAWSKNEEFSPYNGNVSALIRATNLSETIADDDPLALTKRFMRDSDILGWQYTDYSEQLIEGLRKEKGIEPYRKGFTKHFEVHSSYARAILENLVLPGA